MPRTPPAADRPDRVHAEYAACRWFATRRWFAASVPLLLALGFAACPARYVRNYPPPSGDRLLAALRARQVAAVGANMETRTTSYLGGERVRATVLMLAARPGRLRFEAEISLKGTVAALATDGERFGLLEMDARRYRHGPACPRNVAALVQIPLGPREIAAILLGDVFLPADAVVKSVGWDADRGAEVLETVDRPAPPATDRGASSHLWIFMKRMDDATSFAVVGVEGEAAGGSGRWRVAYQDLTSIGGVFHPRTILFAEPGRSFDDGVEINIRDRRLNPRFSDDAFRLAVPPDFTDVPVGCESDDPSAVPPAAP